MPAGFFGPVTSGIDIEDSEDDLQDENDDTKEDTFFEAEEDLEAAVTSFLILELLASDSLHPAARLSPATFPSRLQSRLTPSVPFQSNSGL